jgi:hypothetical protein
MSPAVLLAALALAPWVHPLAFRPVPGWQTGASGNTHSVYVGGGRRVRAPEESAAWIARGVRYRDDATADPPNATLAHLPAGGVVVWAVIYAPAAYGDRPIRLDLARARHLPCCDGVGVVGGEDELAGSAGGGRYSVIVRVYYGSGPTQALRQEAQRALTRLELPAGG